MCVGLVLVLRILLKSPDDVGDVLEYGFAQLSSELRHIEGSVAVQGGMLSYQEVSGLLWTLCL